MGSTVRIENSDRGSRADKLRSYDDNDDDYFGIESRAKSSKSKDATTVGKTRNRLLGASRAQSKVSTQTSKPVLQIPGHLEDKVMLNYHNVLPSNIRHGKNKPMPLIPHGLDTAVTKTDHSLFQKLLNNSSYHLGQGFKSKSKHIAEILASPKERERQERAFLADRKARRQVDNTQTRNLIKEA